MSRRAGSGQAVLLRILLSLPMALVIQGGCGEGNEAASPGCEQLPEGAGVVEPDGADDPWYESEACLSAREGCVVLPGQVGDWVCIHLGSGGGIRGVTGPVAEVDGDCVAHRDTYTRQQPPEPAADSSFIMLHLYELVQAGECTVKVRSNFEVDTTEGYGNFDVFFEVSAP
jgi:hypothetical protein